MTKRMDLCDDGTLDTVVSCPVCGQEDRYSEADRDDQGYVTTEWLEEAYETHLEDLATDEPDDVPECHREELAR